MTGKICYYVPSVRRGIIQTDSGKEYAFFMPRGRENNFNGGDIVEFELGQSSRSLATNVILRHRWADILNENHRPLVNQLHNTIKIIC